MSSYQFSEKAYAKMIFHAAKYPHLSINGILLANKSTANSSTTIIEDAIPLFHQCLFVSPMAEIALVQIDAYAEQQDLVVAGYYVAHENFYETRVAKAPGYKIANKIYKNNNSACFVVLDNKFVTTVNPGQAALKVHSYNADTSRWVNANYVIQQSHATLDAVAALLSRGAQKDIADFDNFLDNPKNDWTNEFLNNDIQMLLSMY